jgi:CRISPR-associated endonuclease/helicase Cas3
LSGRPHAIAHIRSTDKAEQYLYKHLFGVGRRSGEFAAKIGCRLAGELQGLLHDLGKYSAEFFAYLHSAAGMIEPDADDYVDPASNKGRIDHSTAGAQLIWRELSTRDARDQVVAKILALNVASHHSGQIDVISSRAGEQAKDNFGIRMSKPEQQAHLDEVLHSADEVVLERFRDLIAEPALIDEVASLLERIRARNDHSVTLHQQFGLAARFLFSCLIDADRIDSAEFERGQERSVRPMGEYAPWSVLVDRLEGHLGTLGQGDTEFINQHRRAIADSCREAGIRVGAGVYTLTVPTGGGKTLASLRFALHQAKERKLDRVIYVIPYTSIIDQNASVTRAILEPTAVPQDQGSIVLEHHSNLTPEQQTWREKILSENWDAPVVFTTMVQFLETLFGGGTRGARRMHQLAKAVLIFDEVQTLPLKCAHMFSNAINFLTEQCKTTVLFCTATQPLLDQVDHTKGAVRLAPESELMRDVAGLF